MLMKRLIWNNKTSISSEQLKELQWLKVNKIKLKVKKKQQQKNKKTKKTNQNKASVSLKIYLNLSKFEVK